MNVIYFERGLSHERGGFIVRGLVGLVLRRIELDVDGIKRWYAEFQTAQVSAVL